MKFKDMPVLTWSIAGVTMALLGGCVADNKRYEPSPEQTLTIREIPASRQLKTIRTGDYFQIDGVLFSDLFNYLRSHELTMTVPVAAEIGETSSMAFYVDDKDLPKVGEGQGNVLIREVPPMTVAVLAFTGENSPERYRNGVAELQRLIDEGKKYQVDGKFYVTYWDSPMWPAFLRHYEITVPVKLRQ